MSKKPEVKGTGKKNKGSNGQGFSKPVDPVVALATQRASKARQRANAKASVKHVACLDLAPFALVTADQHEQVKAALIKARKEERDLCQEYYYKTVVEPALLAEKKRRKGVYDVVKAELLGEHCDKAGIAHLVNLNGSFKN